MDFQARLISTKDGIGIVREVAIIVVVLVIALHPAVIARWAKKLDIESSKLGAKSSEISIAGAKVAFDHATDSVAALANKTNEDLKRLVQELSANASPQNAERVKKIESASIALSSQLQTSLSSARSVQLDQDKIVQDAPGLATGSGSYGIVVSADKKDDLAAYEVQQIKKRSFNNVVIYDRQGFLRTVSLFSDASAANTALPEIQKYRQGAYVINVTKWCPRSSPERTLADAAVFKCQ
jgi:hypothetical protein